MLSPLLLHFVNSASGLHHVLVQMEVGNSITVARWRDFRHICRFWSLAMKEGNENADLKHVEELTIESLFQDLLVWQILI